MNLRKLAKGKPCMVRLPGCSYNPEQTVLAHLNGGGLALKRHDLLACWSDTSCHDLIDGRNHIKVGLESDSWEVRCLKEEIARLEIKVSQYEGVFRTQTELLKLGLQEQIEKWRCESPW